MAASLRGIIQILKKAFNITVSYEAVRQWVLAAKNPIPQQQKRHIIDSGIGKNALIERLNIEVKRRVKYFSTFQSLEGAKVFLGLWCYPYNPTNSRFST